MPEPLTDLERRIFDYMVDYLRENTYQPSIREIGRRFGIKSTKTVSEYLQSLARKGWVERDPSRSRGVKLLGIELGAGPVRPQTAASPPLPSITAEVPGGRLVEVTAEGARELGARRGDLLLVEAADEAALDDGDAVVCRYLGQVAAVRCRTDDLALAVEWSLGHLIPLRPQRAAELEVLGRAVGLWRSFSNHGRSAGSAIAGPHPAGVSP